MSGSRIKKATLTMVMYTTTGRGPGSKGTARRGTVSFQYIGNLALTVIGPGTRSRYVFGQPGHMVSVDVRDAQALLKVPHLRQMRGA